MVQTKTALMPAEFVATERPIPGAAMPVTLRRPRSYSAIGTGVVARAALAFVAWWTVVVLIQVGTGAYQAEAGRYSDDAAHFMNGMLVRDYLTTGLGQNPITFAENYYLSYPKIAPLMWPPLFHGVLGLLLLLGGAPYETALLLVAAVTAWLVWRIHRIVEQIAGALPAFLAAGLTLSTNVVAGLSGGVMLDLAIAACALEAVYWLSRYVQSESKRHAALFGVFAAAACLTKGNGLAVLLTPAFLMVLTGRYDLLRKRGLYLAGAIVLLAATPLVALNVRYEASIDSFGPLTAPLLLDRVSFYSLHLWRQLGPVLLALGTTGVVLAALARYRSRPRSSDYEDSLGPILVVALASLVISVLLFHLLVPLRIIGVNRYLAPVIAPFLGIACLTMWTVVAAIKSSTIRKIGFPLAIGIVVAGSWATRLPVRAAESMGYREMIGFLHDRGELANARLLVISDEFGEGAFVTEAARLGLRPAPMMIRGSKFLATDDWVGNHFKLRYGSSSELLSDLEAVQMSYVLIDGATSSVRLPYFEQISSLATLEPTRFVMIKSVSGGRPLRLYKVTNPTVGRPEPIELILTHTIGRSLIR